MLKVTGLEREREQFDNGCIFATNKRGNNENGRKLGNLRIT